MSARKRLRIVGLGLLAIVGAVNVVNLVVPSRRVAAGTCPSVLMTDDQGTRLGASVVAGALYPWAETRDVAPLPGAPTVDGEYRLRLANGGEDTTDLIESMTVLVVDHDATTEILATPSGRLVAARDTVAAATATRVTGQLETWTVDLARPTSRRALLVLQGRSTPFAEKAFLQYLATMGRGVSPLMEHAVRTDCGTTCAREVMSDELERLGLPLRATVGGGTAITVAPTSPALARRFAVPIDLPAEGDHVTVRLEATPGFWELDAITLATEGDEVTSRSIAPRVATIHAPGGAGMDVGTRLADGDGERVVITPGGHIDARFVAPPPASAKRSVFVAVRGHYRVPIGGALLHPLTILAHRAGVTSLPRYAAELPRP